MNCESVFSQLGFRCKDLGGDTLRVWSPFAYTGDGERIGFYVERTRNGYRVSDNCEALMHAASRGITITQARMQAIRRATGEDRLLSDEGEIATFVAEDNVGGGMAAVLNTALAVSHFETQWAPRYRADSFSKEVEFVLEDALGQSQVLRKVEVIGASGHQLELPLAIQWHNGLTYVQPIAAADDGGVDWRRVYETWGRMADLKNARINGTDRLVVLEVAANDSDMKHAMTVIADSAPVVSYLRLRQWVDQRRSA